MSERLYHLEIRRVGVAGYERLTVEPLTHHEAMTMKSKFHPERQSRMLVVEADASRS